MAPSPTSDTPETQWFSVGKLLHIIRSIFQREHITRFFWNTKPQDSARSFMQKDVEPEPQSLEEISERFGRYLDDVSQPKYHQALKSTLDAGNQSKLSQCICLGLGSFGQAAPWLRDGPRGNRSLHQLAVLTVILGIIKDRHPINAVYFQDPDFIDVEKQFLQSLGYEVLESPAASEKMSTSTFLFAPFLLIHVAADALAVAFPTLYMGNSPEWFLETLAYHRDNPEKSHSLCQDIIKVLSPFQNASFVGEPLPGFEQQIWTERTTVHWLSPTYTDSAKDKD